jgi:CO/xanthine dehydrogenase Mo-binding subunit
MAVFGKVQYIKRVEDDRLLTGTGGSADNLARPHQAHVVLVCSPHAHARSVKTDGDERDHGCAVVARRAQRAGAGDAASRLARHPEHQELTRRR